MKIHSFLTVMAMLLGGGAMAERVVLFDGKTLDGWNVREGEEKWWSVRDGLITGGSLEENVPINTYLTTDGSYANFDLRFSIRMVPGEGFVNSGMQVRSIRDEGSAMKGYQVDAGQGYWGDLYDEHRRNAKIAGAVDQEALMAVVKEKDWNEYRVLAEGPRIRTWINGVAALDFTEEDAAIPLDGVLGLQAHSGGKFLVQMKDVSIEVLAPTPGAASWRDGEARTPEEQRQSFVVPEGFEVELVASEEQGVGKPITVAWDAGGRMWTMTALDYPVDANENAAAAEAMYAKGGQDRVLVFDEPWKSTPQTPRVFAEGLAIPLGILPWKKGVLVQYGHEIRYYEDRSGDGKADGYEVVLKGFGIQDSHLFPHQFERSPGGWFYLAQGLFNYSEVMRPDGSAFRDGRKSVPFNQCKLARARLDGSAFEVLTAGPNNIWGLVTAKDGREFLQEANDIGHPVSEFIAGAHYPTGSAEKLRPYAPQLPASTAGQPMGGTGLSGLALAEDAGSAFAADFPGEKVFYLANPITNRIQIVTQRVDEKGHPVYTKREDFLTTRDPWFRPVAAHFGPDGCLYIVDWYNKIISHNEVPRTHPDRDKSRGRIWRVRARGMAVEAPPNLAEMESVELIAHLGAAKARVGRLTWQELGDRRDVTVVPRLKKLSGDGAQALERRLGALWALQEMGALEVDFLAKLAVDARAEMRCQVLTAAGDLALGEADFLAMLRAGEEDFHVLCALANALRRQEVASAGMIAAVAERVGPPAEGTDRAGYERNFFRYLVRWAMEEHRGATAELLEGGAEISAEARILAVLALPPAEAAPALVRALPGMDRALVGDELALLGGQLAQPEVAAAFSELLEDGARREGMLRALLQLDPATASDADLREKVGAAAAALVAERPETIGLIFDIARRFQLVELAPVIRGQVESAKDPAALAAALRTLNEIRAAEVDLAAKFLDHADAAVAREALAGYAAAGGVKAVDEIGRRWSGMPGALRQIAVDGMVARPETAEYFARLVAAGGFTEIDGSVVEKLAAALGARHPAFLKVLENVRGLTAPALRLPGKPGAVVATGLDLAGAFTVESWVRLDEGIDNRDAIAGARAKGIDINFYDSRLRFYAGRDVVIADRPTLPGVWTHCAVVRDDAGKVTLYLDGELAGVSESGFEGPVQGLDLGRANADGGTGGRFIEWRVWDRARTSDELRAEYLTSLPAGTPGLVAVVKGMESGLELEGGAAVEWLAEFPALLTPEEAAALNAKFERFRGFAAKPGNLEAGRILFGASCLICHQVNGEGVAIGPNLSGAGAMGSESLLRNILTPNAQLESGYYRHDLSLHDGSLVSGFLASEDGEVIVIRQIGADDRAIRKAEVKERRVSKRSLMPEGLIDGFSETQVADLMTYLMSLR